MTDTVRSEPAASAPVADDPAPAHGKRPPGARPRPAVRSTAARWFGRPRRSVGGVLSLLAGSAAIALGLCDAINHWFLAPGGLQVSTDVVGYPTVRDFDSVHYVELFLLAAVYLQSAVPDDVQSSVPDDVRLTLRRSRQALG